MINSSTKALDIVMMTVVGLFVDKYNKKFKYNCECDYSYHYDDYY